MYRESEAGAAHRLPSPGAHGVGTIRLSLHRKEGGGTGTRNTARASQLEGMRWGLKSGASGRSPWLPTALCCQEYGRPKLLFSLMRLWKEHRLPFLEGNLESIPFLRLGESPSPLETCLPGLGLVEVVVQDPSEAPALGWCVGWGFGAAPGPG